MPVSPAERERRRRLFQAHLDAENAHDLSAIMATFADPAENTFNATAFNGHEAIARAHTSFGWTNTPGALEGLRSTTEGIYYTDEDIVVVARLNGKFVRPLGPIMPTNTDIALRGMAMYRFDEADKLVRERVVINLAPLAGAVR
jgi:hypothetical protein